MVHSTELYCVLMLNTTPCTAGLKAQHDPPQLQKQNSSSQVTDILKKKQRPKDDHLSTSTRFFSLSLGIGSKGKGPPFNWSSSHYVSICLYLESNTHLCVPSYFESSGYMLVQRQLQVNRGPRWQSGNTLTSHL